MRVHPQASDVQDHGLAPSTAGGTPPAIADLDLEDHVGGAPQQDTQAAIDRLLRSIDPDLGEAPTTFPE